MSFFLKSTKLSKIWFYLIYLLAFFMPFQNLLVQFLTKRLGAGAFVASLKDAFLLLIMILLSAEILRMSLVLKKNLKSSKTQTKKLWYKIFLPLILVLILNILAFLSSFVFNTFNFRAFIFGYYFELWWLDFFALVAVYLNFFELETKLQNQFKKDIQIFSSQNEQNFDSNSKLISPQNPFPNIEQNTEQNFAEFHKQTQISNFPTKLDSFWLELKDFRFNLNKIIATSFLLVSLVAGLSLVFGQSQVLGFFGYGAEVDPQSLISSSNACHQWDYQINVCRISGTFSHPLHFATYLLLILPIFLSNIFDPKNSKKIQIFYSILTFLNLFLILASFSRFAILGLFSLFTFLAVFYLHKKNFLPLKFAKIIFGLALFISCVSGILVLNLNFEKLSNYLPKALIKPSSSTIHARLISANTEIFVKGESKILTGYGIGVSGSAARQKYQDVQKNPIYQKFSYVAFKWGLLPEPMLLPDNWFLQTTLNAGVFYTLVYLVLIFLPIVDIRKIFAAKIWNTDLLLQTLPIFGFLSVFIGNLLQHLWENQTVVFYWVLIFILFKLILLENQKNLHAKAL